MLLISRINLHIYCIHIRIYTRVCVCMNKENQEMTEKGNDEKSEWEIQGKD